MGVTKEEGIELLKNAKEQLGKTEKLSDAKPILALAGKMVGYKPALGPRDG